MKPTSNTKKQRNRRITTPRVRVRTRLWRDVAQMDGKLVRCMGLVRTTLTSILEAASYTRHQLRFLKERGLPIFSFEGRDAQVGPQSARITEKSHWMIVFV